MSGIERTVSFDSDKSYDKLVESAKAGSACIARKHTIKVTIKNVACVVFAIIAVVGMISCMFLLAHINMGIILSNIGGKYIAAILGSAAIGLISAVFSKALAKDPLSEVDHAVIRGDRYLKNQVVAPGAPGSVTLFL